MDKHSLAVAFFVGCLATPPVIEAMPSPDSGVFPSNENVFEMHVKDYREVLLEKLDALGIINGKELILSLEIQRLKSGLSKKSVAELEEMSQESKEFLFINLSEERIQDWFKSTKEEINLLEKSSETLSLKELRGLENELFENLDVAKELFSELESDSFLFESVVIYSKAGLVTKLTLSHVDRQIKSLMLRVMEIDDKMNVLKQKALVLKK